MSIHNVILLTFLFYCCVYRISSTAASTENDLSNDINRTPLTKIGNKYYWIETDKELNWFEAVHFCRTKGTYLASIESEEESNALSAYLVSKGLTHWYWTSGNDLITEGDWNWLSTGKKMTYTNWDNGQPDNGFGGEHCMNIWRYGDIYRWNDNSCHNKSRYICESRTPVPFVFAEKTNF